MNVRYFVVLWVNIHNVALDTLLRTEDFMIEQSLRGTESKLIFHLKTLRKLTAASVNDIHYLSEVGSAVKYLSKSDFTLK